MIKKSLFLLIAFFSLLPAALSARQQAVGSWFTYPLYKGVPDRIVDTPSNVYYLSLGRLYGYDKTNDETREYIDVLSDAGIAVIDYNAACKFLFIGYENGNVDLLYDNGRVVNLPDIKEAQIAYDKGINEVDFFQHLIYVATKFGLVVFDSDKGVVRKSGIYGKNVKAVGAQGDYIIINTDNRNYAVNRMDQINRFDSFTDLGAIYNVAEMKGMGDYVIIRTNNQARPVSYDIANAKEYVVGTATSGAASPLMRGGDGKMRTAIGGKLYAYAGKGTRTEEAAIPSALSENAYGTWLGAGSLWAGNADGVGQFDITGSGFTVKNDRMRPADAVPMLKGAYFAASADGRYVYMVTSGDINTNNPGSAYNSDAFMCAFLPDGTVKDVSPSKNLKASNGNALKTLKGITAIAVHPDDPEMVILATYANGVYFVKNGEQIANVVPSSRGRHHGLHVDSYKNLWVMNLDTENKAVMVLPASKFTGDVTKISASDFVTARVSNFKGNSDGEFASIPGSNLIFFHDAIYKNPLGVYDTNGTVTNTADDKCLLINDYFDQDGKSLVPIRYTALAVDRNNDLWVGTDAGPFKITNTREVMTGRPSAHRLKVARNDGSNFADYLLDGEWVTSIAVDGSNKKWIATRSSGLYYVSAAGDEIIAHFTTENSPLPTNTINKIYVNPLGNEVYVATNLGVLCYSGFNSPGQPTFDDVYAYPNPVKPGYTGWITVKGLMNNSLVKIADSSGNVVYQGRSDGGMFTWDGCNSAGARVKSGVYYVFASQNEGGSSSAAVTKILIMN